EFYFNPIAIRETDLFKKSLIRAIRKLRPLNKVVEELTSFLIVRLEFNASKLSKIMGLEELSNNDLSIKLSQELKNKFSIIYDKYLLNVKNRFLKTTRNNRELLESYSILVKNLALTEEERETFNLELFDYIEKKSEFYFEVIKNATLSIATLPEEHHSYFDLGAEQLEVKSKKSVLQLIDELILFNFSTKYTEKTNEILEQFLSCLEKMNSSLKEIKIKSNELNIIIDLLKGKSFEVFDNIFDIRRQIARQNRADSDLIKEISELKNKKLITFIETHSSKNNIKEIVTQTDKAISLLEEWFELIRLFEFLEDENQLMSITLEQSNCIKQIFIQMELLRIWSEFFYDISYYTVRKGRVLDSPDIEIKEEIKTSAVLVVEDVYKTYVLPQSRVYALRGVSFEIQKGEFLAIMGPSGAGKTTLVNILTGLDSPDKGAVYLNGKNIALMDDLELTEFRRDEIGLIFQFYQLFPELTALENVSMPAEMANIPVKKARAKAQEILEIVDLGSFANQYPDKLSGGQQQRVAIARALVNDPSIVVADQLTGDLDSVTGMQIIGYLRKINRERGTTVLLVTHNKTVATQADRIITIEDGELIEEIDMKAIRSTEIMEEEE
nr:ABC transporter ATP-binding protein [Asgard group archaeon]